jgi:amicyanin
MTGLIARLALAAAIAATLANAPVRAEDTAVKISNFTFNPPQITVKSGTTVTWTNEDDIPHTIVSPPSIRSKALDSDDKFSFTFTTPGTYKYFCSLHPHMTGTIVVEAKTGEKTGDNTPK